jgi:antitoxin FitA-like protein
MATLVIKNLPEELHAALKARAERHRRSLTKEAVTLIETALAVGPRAAPALPPPVKLKGGPLTTAEIEAWIAKSHD